MITEESVTYFLSTPYEHLKDGEYHFLVEHFFKVSSKEWYVENKEDTRLDLNEKEGVFWKLIRQHAMPFCIENKYFDFSGFVFPKFQNHNLLYKTNRCLLFPENFWEKDGIKEFAYDVDFMSARFLGEAYFKNTLFLGKASFKSCKFFGSVNFIEAVFLKETTFLGVKFPNSVNFSSAQFSKEHTTLFHDCYRDEKENKEYPGLLYTVTDRRVYFDFSNVELHHKLVFRRIHFHTTSFYITNITKDVRFEECKWEGNYRVLLFAKQRFKQNTYEDLQERYRQLKLNYANFQEWNMSGKAYRSEMHAKQWLSFFQIFNYKKPFTIPVRIMEFLMSAFYGLFSGYTQSITKPFVWLIVSTLFIFPLFYTSCSFTELFTCDYVDVLRSSAKNTFPFFKFNTETSDYIFWVALVQKIFSSTLLAFFILALRKRFKQ